MCIHKGMNMNQQETKLLQSVVGRLEETVRQMWCVEYSIRHSPGHEEDKKILHLAMSALSHTIGRIEGIVSMSDEIQKYASTEIQK